MTNSEISSHEKYPDSHHGVYNKTIFGFWVYILTDFMLFATIFAAYIVLEKSVYGGPSAHELFSLPYTLTQTLLLLFSSFTIGLAGTFVHRRNKSSTIALLLFTFLFGITFMAMELNELTHLVSAGNSWERSAFLSAFFTLVATHGIHMIFALIWIIVLVIPVFLHGVKPVSIKRLTCLRLFWQFLNIIWIFIFTIVYLMGVN